MTNPFEDKNGTNIVLINAEGQYSLRHAKGVSQQILTVFSRLCSHGWMRTRLGIRFYGRASGDSVEIC